MDKLLIAALTFGIDLADDALDEPEPPPGLSITEAALGAVVVAGAATLATLCIVDWCHDNDVEPQPE